MKSNKRLILRPIMEERTTIQEYSDKQRHILEASEKLFATKGYDGTSVRDIAHEAGVNIAMISYYFGSKEKLLEALFQMRTQEMRVMIEGMLADTDTDSMEKMYRLAGNYVDRMMNHHLFHKIMIREQIAESETLISASIKDNKKRNRELIIKLITEGQDKGVFKKDIDVMLVMMTMFGTLNYMISSQHHYREINNLQDMPDDEFKTYISNKLKEHLKLLFRTMLQG